MHQSDEWLGIVQALRAYAMRRYGAWATGLTIHMADARREHYEPFPPLPMPNEEKRPDGPAAK